MTEEFQEVLNRNGYMSQWSGRSILIRKKVLGDWKFVLLFFILSIAAFGSAYLFKSMGKPALALFFGTIALAFLGIPFLDYFTSAFKSLRIDLDNKSLFFRSAYSRAYRFFEIIDVKLELVGNEPVSIWNRQEKVQRYIISLAFSNHAKEELLSLTFAQDENEEIVFRLKDYFYVLFKK